MIRKGKKVLSIVKERKMEKFLNLRKGNRKAFWCVILEITFRYEENIHYFQKTSSKKAHVDVCFKSSTGRMRGKDPEGCRENGLILVRLRKLSRG